MEAMEKLLAPSRKFQATMEAMDKLLIPTRKYQTAMDSIGKALAPSREYQAAMEALEKRLTIARSQRSLEWGTGCKSSSDRYLYGSVVRCEFQSIISVLKVDIGGI